MIVEGRRVAKPVEFILWDYPAMNGKYMQAISKGVPFPPIDMGLRMVGYVYTDVDAVVWLRENNFVFAIDNVD